MTAWDEKVRVMVGSISLELPALLVRRPNHPVDTSAGVFEAEGLTVIVDDGPFADRLDRVGGAEYEERTVELAGCTGRWVSFFTPGENIRTTGYHSTAPRVFTILVRADVSVSRDVVEDIFRSLQVSINQSGGKSNVEFEP